MFLTVIVLALRSEEPEATQIAMLEPAEALETFQGQHGFRMKLVAAEPLVYDPVAAAFDEDGRLYVVEMSDYPHQDPEHDQPFAENTLDPPIGRVRLLIDRNGDGRFDEGHLFAEGLSWPTGIVPWKGGVFVAATPDIWYLKDRSGDHKADLQRKIFTGFRKFNIQAVMNNLIWGLDHQIYGAAASNGGLVRPADDPGAEPVNVARRDFRFDPESLELEAISGGARFGNSFDDWGNRFLCNIRNPAQHVVLPSHYLERNPYLPAPAVLHDAALAGDTIEVFRISPPEPWRMLRAERWTEIGKNVPRSELVGAGSWTSSSGVTVYRGDAYPPEFQGNLFIAEVANNVVHRQQLEPDGVTFRARRADPDVEFLASTDIAFRPVNFVNAPDGTLYVLDMYRETIEHPWSIPEDILATLDMRRGEDRGRIYRIEPPDYEHRPAPRLSDASTEDLVSLLEHPNAWHRETAHRLLFERQDPSAVPLLNAMLYEGDRDLGRLHALWSLEGLHALRSEILLQALADEAPGVREHAVRLAESRLAEPALLEALLKLAGDENPRVRLQVAFSLGATDAPKAVDGLVQIAVRDAADPWLRVALLSSSTRHPAAFFQRLLDVEPLIESPEGLSLSRALALVIGASGDVPAALQAARTLAERVPDVAAGRLEHSDRTRQVLEVATGLADGLRRAGTNLGDLPLEARESELFEQLSRFAAQLAQDEARAVDDRVRGIVWLGFGSFERANEVVPTFIDPSQPQAVQVASVAALARFDESSLTEHFIKCWDQATPAVHAELLQALLSRPSGILAVLDAVEAGTIAAGQIPANRRAALLSYRDAEIQDRAKSLLGDGVSGSRAEVLAQYQAALDRTQNPDLERGREVFERECMSCHQLGAQGHEVGPNLASIAHRTAEEVLLHILDPNREVAPDYLDYSVALNDGRVVTGLIAAETATSLTLRRAEGEEETLLRSEIEEITSSGQSLMPEGLEASISPEAMADLLAFLLNLQRL